jgi:formate dehydrogenase subunit gamma
MAETMSPPETRPETWLLRFTRAERWVHRSTALLLGVCLATAACLYVGPLAVLVGRRALIKDIHVYAGCLLPVPLLLGWLSAALRADLRWLNRFAAADWEWLRSADRRSGRVPVGKFNAGQKLAAAFFAGAILVLLGTGLIMRFPSPWPLTWRTGATFGHDWLALALLVVVLGHLVKAGKDPVARAGMRTGLVPLDWARREHRTWAEEQTHPDAPDGTVRSGHATPARGTARGPRRPWSPRRGRPAGRPQPPWPR